MCWHSEQLVCFVLLCDDVYCVFAVEMVDLGKCLKGRVQIRLWSYIKIKCHTIIMIDNTDLPLPNDQLKIRVLVFAITDDTTHQYDQITKGYVDLVADQDDNNKTFHYLQVKDEQTNEVLMRSNLKLQNNFGKQKDSIISWTDQQQPLYQEIALSFEKDNQCEMFWRVICQKIGKNHLQINGIEKLQLPNHNNLSYILEKTKNDIDLIDYNIAHAGSLMICLKMIFEEMKEKNDQMGMGAVARIINSILCPNYSSATIQALMKGDNFKFLLQVQQFKKGIKFSQVYQQSIGQYLNNKFLLPEDIFQKVQLSHRATFYRQNVLNLIQDSLLESMMLMIVREAQVEIISYLNRSKFIAMLLSLKQYSQVISENKNNQQNNPLHEDNSQSQIKEITSNEFNNKAQQNQNPSQPNHPSMKYNLTNGKNISQLDQDKIHFIHQALVLYQQISSEQVKITFKDNIYSQNLIPFLQTQIINNNPKALEILNMIIEIDKQKFLSFLVQQFRTNSSDNLLKTLIKAYLSQKYLADSVLHIIESLIPIFNENKDLLDFFMSTFVYSVLSISNQFTQVLSLMNIMLSQLQDCSPLIMQVLKCKTLDKIATEYRSGSGLKTKAQELQIIKMMKHIIVDQIQKGEDRNKQIESSLIQSGYLDCCMMIYLKHNTRNNVISSSMLENIKILQKGSYSQIHKYLVEEYSTNESLMKILAPIRLKHISLQNQKSKKIEDISESHQIVHSSILENEQQDDYLMKDNVEDRKQAIQLSHSSTLEKDQMRKKHDEGQSLLIFKRIMSELSSVKEDEQSSQSANTNNVRKIVKKSQDTNQYAQIEFNFDLPEIDQLQNELT